jgi:hypothetical protein
MLKRNVYVAAAMRPSNTTNQQVVAAVRLWRFIREVLGSNLGRDMGYFESRFFMHFLREILS